MLELFDSWVAYVLVLLGVIATILQIITTDWRKTFRVTACVLFLTALGVKFAPDLQEPPQEELVLKMTQDQATENTQQPEKEIVPPIHKDAVIEKVTFEEPIDSAIEKKASDGIRAYMAGFKIKVKGIYFELPMYELRFPNHSQMYRVEDAQAWRDRLLDTISETGIVPNEEWVKVITQSPSGDVTVVLQSPYEKGN